MFIATHLSGFGVDAGSGSGGATPVVAATNNSANTTAVTTHTVSLPASIAAGDLLILFLAINQRAVSSAPSGYTQLVNTAYAGTDTAGGACYYKVADGSEGSTITFGTAVTSRSAHLSLRITGAGTPEAAEGTADASTTVDPPNLTPSGGSKNYLWLAAAALCRYQTISSYPSGYTGGETRNTGTANNNGHASIQIARLAAAAASENPGVFTFGSSSLSAVSMTISVPPA